MKTKLLLLIFLFSFGVVVASCNQKNQYRPDPKIIQAFNAKYPKVTKVEWEPKQGFYTAEFRDKDIEHEAWFDANGKWMLTKSDIRYSMLPPIIQANFEKSIYSNWKKDDVNKIERPEVTTVYVIEAKKEGQETDLYYTENGILLKTLLDQKPDVPMNFQPVPNEISEQIKQKYPDATIIDTDLENGIYEIDILDNKKFKEVTFNGNQWVSTHWNITKAEVPTVVMEAFRQSEYKKYRIEEIHFFETPNSTYYHFELEQGDREVNLSIDPSGHILK